MEKESILVLSNRVWGRELSDRLGRKNGLDVHLIEKKEDLHSLIVSQIDPTWIFVAHWSFIIPSDIWRNWKTVIFHMTDLPYGRGGSPLQNLIKEGFSSTTLSALRCSQALDSGDIYMKMPLSLYGSAEEIYLRANTLIEEMIFKILEENPNPIAQRGKPTYFKRRTPSQSDLRECPNSDLEAWYDHIRMLDADGYPHAFLEFMGMRLKFRRASLRHSGIHADVIITPIDDHSSGSTPQ